MLGIQPPSTEVIVRRFLLAMLLVPLSMSCALSTRRLSTEGALLQAKYFQSEILAKDQTPKAQDVTLLLKATQKLEDDTGIPSRAWEFKQGVWVLRNDLLYDVDILASDLEKWEPAVAVLVKQDEATGKVAKRKGRSGTGEATQPQIVTGSAVVLPGEAEAKLRAERERVYQECRHKFRSHWVCQDEAEKVLPP